MLALADNDPEDEHAYEVHVYTGLSGHAETESRVSLIVAGSESDSGVRRLHDGCRKVNRDVRQRRYNHGSKVIV